MTVLPACPHACPRRPQGGQYRLLARPEPLCGLRLPTSGQRPRRRQRRLLPRHQPSFSMYTTEVMVCRLEYGADCFGTQRGVVRVDMIRSRCTPVKKNLGDSPSETLLSTAIRGHSVSPSTSMPSKRLLLASLLVRQQDIQLDIARYPPPRRRSDGHFRCASSSHPFVHNTPRSVQRPGRARGGNGKGKGPKKVDWL